MSPHWVVCPYITRGCTTESNIRECRCGAQLWVALALVALVDSGALVPQCWDCQKKSGTDPVYIIGVVY
ncbi:MAG: hypothetical protein ACRDQH_13675 [Pseudonocardiaceae bacterium]